MEQARPRAPQRVQTGHRAALPLALDGTGDTGWYWCTGAGGAGWYWCTGASAGTGGGSGTGDTGWYWCWYTGAGTGGGTGILVLELVWVLVVY